MQKKRLARILINGARPGLKHPMKPTRPMVSGLSCPKFHPCHIDEPKRPATQNGYTHSRPGTSLPPGREKGLPLVKQFRPCGSEFFPEAN